MERLSLIHIFSVVVGGLIIVFCKPLVSIFVGSGAVEAVSYTHLSERASSLFDRCLSDE